MHTTMRPAVLRRVRMPLPLLREETTDTVPLPLHVSTNTPRRYVEPVLLTSVSYALSAVV